MTLINPFAGAAGMERALRAERAKNPPPPTPPPSPPIDLWPDPGKVLLPSLADKCLSRDLTRGIITGAKAEHWQCLGALALAAAEYGVGYAVANHGLLDWQVAELDRIGARWIEHEKPSLEIARTRKLRPNYAVWWKPWICLASPFDQSAWIDADAVLLADPAPLWSEPGPAISTEHRWGSAGPGLYAALAEVVFPSIPAELIEQVGRVNTGILAFQRHEQWIWEWAAWCSRLASDRAKVKLCHVREQSAAVVAILNRMRDGRGPIRFLPDEWNIPADWATAKLADSARLPVPANPAELVAVVRERHPGANVVHWLGKTKPWHLIQNDLHP